MKGIKKLIGGVTLCGVSGITAYLLGKIFPIIGGPVFGIVIGMILGELIKSKSIYTDGVKFTSKKVLQYAVISLGFTMNIGEILTQGKISLPIIIVTISTSFAIAYGLYKAFKMEKNVSILIGVGSSICGGSAIAATAPVIDAKEDEVSQAIAVIFFFNVLAAITFPFVGDLLSMSNYGFGMFAGTAINDTSSVTAAATAWDGIHNSNTIAIATIVKLTRTLAIIPITLTLGFIKSRNNKEGGGIVKAIKGFPFFIIIFLLASCFATFVPISEELLYIIKFISKLFITMAMVAIGFNTNFIRLIKTGEKPLIMGLCCCLGIAITSIILEKCLLLF